MKPKCFDSDEQYEAWVECIGNTNVSPGQYCVDCTPEFKKLKMESGECGHPETFFYIHRMSYDGITETELMGYSYASCERLATVTTHDEAVMSHKNKHFRVGLSGMLVS